MPELDLLGYKREQERLAAMGKLAKGAGKLVKGMTYDPIAAVGDMLNWQRITSPDGQVFYMDPQGREYSEPEYQKEIYRRTLGMTLTMPSMGASGSAGSAARLAESTAPRLASEAVAAQPASAALLQGRGNMPALPTPTVRGTPNSVGPLGTIVPSSGREIPRLGQGGGTDMVLGTRGNYNAVPNQGTIIPPSGANVPRLGQSPMEMMPGQRGNFNPIGQQGPIIPPNGPNAPRLPAPSPSTEMAIRPGEANPVIDVVARGNPNPIGPQGPIVTPSGSEIPRLTSSVPPFPPPAGRAPMPPMPPPPPAGAPNAAVRSWFGKLSGRQKAALGAVGAGVGYAVMNKAADTARKQSAPGAQPEQGAAQGGWDIAGGLVDTAVKNASKPSQQPKAAPMPSRAANVLRAASAAQGQAAPQQEAASAAASGADKVPVTTSGRPDYNYYAEMMNAADRNDAYARDLINLKEQARMAAIDAGARGEKFRFVPVKDYMNNRIIFVNAGGNDVVLDMNDPRQGVEYQKLLEKSGVDAATMTDWMHRSSRPMLRYMQPAGGNRDVTPDFGYMRRSVELGEGKPAASTTMATQAPTSAMKQSGNIDLNNRPVVKNADGSISTVRSMSIGTPEGEVLIPTISPDGRVLSENEAIDLFRKTGKHLGIFNTPGQATEYAKQLSSRQGQTYGNASTSEMPTPTAKVPVRPEPQPTSVASVAPTTSAEETDKQLPWTDDQRSALQALRSFRLKSSRFGG